jgi:hypothetical protein
MTSVSVYPNRMKAEYRKLIEDCEEGLQEINADWRGSKVQIIIKASRIALIKLYKIPILILTNLQNINQLDDKKIFPLLLSKYDELLYELYDLHKEMVEINALKEEDYRLFCEKTLKDRKILKLVCDAADDTEDNYEIERV